MSQDKHRVEWFCNSFYRIVFTELIITGNPLHRELF